MIEALICTHEEIKNVLFHGNMSGNIVSYFEYDNLKKKVLGREGGTEASNRSMNKYLFVQYTPRYCHSPDLTRKIILLKALFQFHGLGFNFS